MAVILKHSVILHLPKTGGNYVRAILDHNKISYYTTGRHPCILSQNLFNRKISTHCIPHGHQCFEERKNRLVFVRHPLDWYRSYWAFRAMNHPNNNNAKKLEYWRTSSSGIGYHGCAQVDEKTHSDNFNIWINNILREYKTGPYTEFCNYYCAFSSVIGKTEKLKEHLSIFLSKYEGIKNLDFDIPIVNESSKIYKNAAQYTEYQEKSICSLENVIIDRFYNKSSIGEDARKDFPEQLILT